MTLPMFAAEHVIVDADRDWWCTPQWLVDVIRDALGGQIDFDPCSNPLSVVGASFAMTAAEDGLSRPWPAMARIYCNPPYSDATPWAKACADAADSGSYVVGCFRVDASCGWWHSYIWERATAVCFPMRRVRFSPPPGIEASSPDFAVALPFWSPARGHAVDVFERAMSKIGKVVRL
jgi:phage N-6-adenine-methyltransferase